jgi:solute carrier family 25 (peroxisomal adenine nucleotide transporter), member 17
MISNPIWVVQTSQAVRTLDFEPADPSNLGVVVKKLGFIETVQHILAKDGVGAFWRGIGPALVLVVNPVLQYTVFEQLKNILIKRRTAKIRATGLATAVAVLTDRDFFLLGALSKLGMKTTWVLCCLLLTLILVATASTYPYMCVFPVLTPCHPT